MRHIEFAGSWMSFRFLALAVLIGIALVGCEKHADPPREHGKTVATVNIVASAKGRIDIQGGVVRLAARRDGVIDKVLVEEGMHVNAGQILATLDDVLVQRNLDMVRSEAEQARRQVVVIRIRLAAAEREVGRLEPLAGENIIARQDFDRARDEEALALAEVESLEATVNIMEKRVIIAQHEIDERRIRAPLDGQIIQRQARPGMGVSTLNVTPLFLFAPDGPRIVRAELEERFLNVVKTAQRVEIVLEADPTHHWTGQVLRIGKVVGQRTPSEDPSEKQDNRVVECVLSVDAPELIIGQRVIVRFIAHQ